MKKVTLIEAESNDMDWINSKYSEVNFVKSNYENEYIVIAKVDNENAGLGRLVKIDNENNELGGVYTFPDFIGQGIAERIVKHLLIHNPFNTSTIWCLPFENLLHFYFKFGFERYEQTKAPEKIIRKLEWCNTENTYSMKVILLCFKNQKIFSSP